ncbi:MAG: 2-amino-3-ketobutyrate coenzyme ligase, partial [Chitinophagaceae bacterium]|nr:2-amino-3-ketobutyrate coenzyme ligase [Chitinophagaceae bacterium]
MFDLDGKPGRIVSVNGNEYLFFSGYDYLGISHNSFFEKLVTKGIQQYGWLYPSSRISNTRLPLYEKMEQHLTSLTQTTETVLFPSGFLAGRAASQLFAHRCKPFTAPSTHPAIAIYGRSFMGTFSQWSEMVMQTLSGSDIYELPVLIADSLQPLTAEINDFSFLQHIDRKVICI